MPNQQQNHHVGFRLTGWHQGFVEMSDSDSSPMALAATGRFQEALATLARRRQGKSARMTATERLEFAELLEQGVFE